MNKTIKKKWLTALRSGKYKQAYGQLKLGDCYCCLGVLCVVAGIKISEYGDDEIEGDYTNIYKALKNKDMASTLWRMNDTENKTFSEIANYIEVNL